MLSLYFLIFHCHLYPRIYPGDDCSVSSVQMGKGGLLPHGPAGGGLTNINGLNGLTGFGPGVLSPAGEPARRQTQNNI